MNNKLFIRIVVALLATIIAVSALAPAFAGSLSRDDIEVVTSEGNPAEGVALVTREYINAGGRRITVAEDTVYIDGSRIRREFRPEDGTLAREEHFRKQQLSGGGINWRIQRLVEYGADGTTVTADTRFDN